MVKGSHHKPRKQAPYTPTYRSELEQADERDDYDCHEVDPTLEDDLALDAVMDDDLEYDAMVDYNNQGQFTGDHIPENTGSPAVFNWGCIALLLIGILIAAGLVNCVARGLGL